VVSEKAVEIELPEVVQWSGYSETRLDPRKIRQSMAAAKALASSDPPICPGMLDLHLLEIQAGSGQVSADQQRSYLDLVTARLGCQLAVAVVLSKRAVPVSSRCHIRGNA
jgi:hypothetical protein